MSDWYEEHAKTVQAMTDEQLAQALAEAFHGPNGITYTPGAAHYIAEAVKRLNKAPLFEYTEKGYVYVINGTRFGNFDSPDEALKARGVALADPDREL